jgi:hypothetical protein
MAAVTAPAALKQASLLPGVMMISFNGGSRAIWGKLPFSTLSNMDNMESTYCLS